MFPLFYFLVIYFLFLAVWLIFSLIGVYHMVRFGAISLTTFFATFFYIVVAIIMLNISYNFLIPIDWSTNVSLFNNINSNLINF